MTGREQADGLMADSFSSLKKALVIKCLFHEEGIPAVEDGAY